MKRRVLVLIPARRGSKGLRHKNLQRIGGQSLLELAIAKAQKAATRHESWDIVCSTDSKHYAAIATKAGARVPFLRAATLANDDTRLIDVVVDALERLTCAGRHYDVVCLLQTTTPLVTAHDVRAAMRRFRRGRGEAVVSVTPLKRSQSWHFERDPSGILQGPNRVVVQRPKANCFFVLNGAIFIATPQWIFQHRQFAVPGQATSVVIPASRSIDIEDSDDLKIARILMARQHEEG